MIADYEIFVRDKKMRFTSQVVAFDKLELVLRYNRKGKWRMSGVGPCPFTRGDGVVIRRSGAVIFSGMAQKFTRKVENKKDLVQRTWEVEGTDDFGALLQRLALPDPVGLTFNTVAYDVRSGPAETVVLDYIRYNAGPLADPTRRMPGLTVPTSQGRGVTVPGKARFYNLFDYVCNLLDLANIGLRVDYNPTTGGLDCAIFEPVDRSGQVKFSVDLGNLKAFTYTEAAPVANYVYCLGQGEGVNRAIRTAFDQASINEWGRIEGYKDQRNESDASNLDQWAQRALTENAAKKGFSITPLEGLSFGFQYGNDYGLGDVVTVYDDGDTLIDQVGEITFELNKDDEKITPSIGKGNKSASSPLAATFDRVNSLESRLTSMEVDA